MKIEVFFLDIKEIIHIFKKNYNMSDFGKPLSMGKKIRKRNRDPKRIVAYWKSSLTWVLSLLLFFIVIINVTNDYTKEKDIKCVVLDKLTSGGESSNFYLVLKDDKNRVFDLIVSPATYSQSKVGSNLVFSLQEMDIRQTVWGNIIYFVLPILLYSLFIIVFFLSLIFHYDADNKIKDNY